MKRFRWVILGLLFLASVINYIDRQSLSILARTIQDDLHISDIGYSNVLQMFLLAYALSFLVAGWITDRLGVRLSMTLFIAWWSVSNILTGFVASLRGLGATRFLLGAGESGLYVVAPKVVAQLFPPSQRGLAVGIYSAGATVGATIAPPLIALLTLHYGWRAAFIGGGLLGLIWAVPWVLTYRAPVAESNAQPTAAIPIAAEDDGSRRWWHVLRADYVLPLVLIRVLTDPVWQFILFWFPKYLTDVHHLSLERIGRIGWVPYLAADIGGVLGGYASGVLVQRGFRPVDARKWVMVLCAILIPVGALLVPLIGGSGIIVILVAVIAFAEFTWMVTATALAVDVLPVGRFGRTYGVIAAGSGLGGMVFMNIVGHLVTKFSYTPVFVLMACVHPIALLLVWRIARVGRSLQTPFDQPGLSRHPQPVIVGAVTGAKTE